MSSDTPQSLVPHHIGIIPDGNRRWAKDRGLPSFEGHRRGLVVSREIATAAFHRGVKVFSMYAFSTENWRRAEDEVGYLMEIFYGFVTTEFKSLAELDVRFRFAGSRERLSPRLLKAIDKLEADTRDHVAGTLVICLNYGGQQEIADAAAQLIRDGVAADDVTPELLASRLYVPEVPPADFVIRTSNEMRLSNFMLWRTAYSELYFVDKHWPDFTVDDLNVALDEFAGRQRRFGS